MARPALPSGTVTFLFTDMEGSTKLLHAHPDAYRKAIKRHHDLLLEAVQLAGGVVFETVGDAVYGAFSRPTDAAKAALWGQLALVEEEWGETPIRVRMGVHMGEVELQRTAQGDHYFGAALYRCARLMSTAHGGQVVLSAVAAEAVRDALPDGADLLNLGEHRLKDLARPEHVWQLTHPQLAADFPALRSLDALPNNLPLQVTSFIGRERELAEVQRLLSGARLLTLTGTGGSGKTRLSLQAAADVIDAYEDGVWFVDLAPLADPAHVPGAALAALGLSEQPGQPAQATLAGYLRQRHALLLLDNCEHVIEACARLVDAIIHQCPGVRILATSREMLGVAGETAWRVPSLALPEPDGAPGAHGAYDGYTAQRLEQYEAVRLFIDRALAVQPSFQVTNQNAPAVAQVCHRLDGIPLALELAAARVRVLSVEQIAARLTDRFRLLTGGGRTALRRQQTLQALVDWSHDLLSEPERALFRRLAVFAGGFTIDAIELVCAGEPVESFEALDLLTGLVDKSLVVAGGADAEQRYRLLETLRQYAEDKLLQAGEAAALRDRHLQWCVALACAVDQADRADDGKRLEQAWTQYRAESANVRAAFTWGAATPEGAALALEMFANIEAFPSEITENAAWLETLLALAPARTSLRVRALNRLDHTRRWLHNFTGAQAANNEARAIAEEIGDDEGQVVAMAHAGLIAANLGDYTGASDVERAVEVSRARGVLRWIERFTRDLGVISIAMGDYTRAGTFLQEGRDVALRLGAVGHARRCGGLLGIVARLSGDLPGARRWLDGIERELPEDSQLRGYGQLRWAIANLLRDEGHLDEARTTLAGALRTLRQRGEIGMLADPVCMLAMVDIAAGDAVRGVTIIAACTPEDSPIGTIHVPEVRVEAPIFLERARAVLGDGVYAAAWARGRRLSLLEAVALALGETPDPPDA